MATRHELAGAVGSLGRNAGLKGIGKACVEALEGRTLLAVTAGEYDAIRSSYPGFGLPADMGQVNIIEITPDQLSVANLKSAITTAGSTALPDLVVLRTTDTQNTITYAGSADAISIDIPSAKGAISIVGLGSRPLTIDAANQSRVISVGSAFSSTTVNLGGLTLTRGYTTSSNGGGLYQSYGTVALTNVTISGNRGSYGGGVHQYYGTSTLTNVTISGNTGYSGGGVYAAYGASALTNVTISGNTTSSGGGGLYQYYGTLTLTNATLSENRATEGGGMRQYYGTSTLTDVTISGNTVSDYGGGIYQYNGTLNLTNATISGNAATSAFGGGVYSSGTSTLTNVRISGNTARYGGGMCQSATSILANVTISGNTASDYGGGVFQEGTSTLTNVTVSRNMARSGGGVYVAYSGRCTLRNTIVARNAAGAGTDVYQYTGGTLSGSNNLIGDGSGQSSLVNGSNGNIVGSSASPIDPKLAEGSGFGIALSPVAGSPTIDAGDDSLIPMGISTDIYGAARIEGARVNIGAVETVLAGTAGVTYVVTSFADGIAVDGVVTLREALAAANGNQAVGDAPAGSSSSVDVITFAPDLSGTIRTNGQAYQISGSVSISGPGSSQLTLDGGGMSGVLDIREVYDVSINGMTITRGNALEGGGIYAAGSHLTLDRMVVSGNTASSYGGGVYQFFGRSTLTNVTMSGNTASDDGGGLYQYYGTSMLTNVTVSGNTASSGYGGGIHQVAGTLVMMNAEISGNTATRGGGVYLSE